MVKGIGRYGEGRRAFRCTVLATFLTTLASEGSVEPPATPAVFNRRALEHKERTQGTRIPKLPEHGEQKSEITFPLVAYSEVVPHCRTCTTFHITGQYRV